MHKNIFKLAFFAIFISSTLVLADKTDKKNTITDYLEITVLDKGVKRTVQIPKTDAQKYNRNTVNRKVTLSKKGVMITFKKSFHVNIAEFEAKYGLKLKKKLVTGYYLFDNISSSDDMEIIGNIIKNEKNIITVKPNWKKQNSPR